MRTFSGPCTTRDCIWSNPHNSSCKSPQEEAGRFSMRNSVQQSEINFFSLMQESYPLYAAIVSILLTLFCSFLFAASVLASWKHPMEPGWRTKAPSLRRFCRLFLIWQKNYITVSLQDDDKLSLSLIDLVLLHNTLCIVLTIAFVFSYALQERLHFLGWNGRKSNCMKIKAMKSFRFRSVNYRLKDSKNIR